MTSDANDNPFWVFSTGFYGREGVAAECLCLQDECGVDVNLLLYCLWCASLGRALDRERLAALDSQVAGWRQQVVLPLRGLRRSLVDSGAEEVREAIKTAELLAEQRQQRMMYEFPGSPNGEPRSKLASESGSELDIKSGGEFGSKSAIESSSEPDGFPPLADSLLRDNLAALAEFYDLPPQALETIATYMK